jgi:hypothetical protein
MKQFKAYIVGGDHNGTTASVSPDQHRLQLHGSSYSRLPDWMMHCGTPVFCPPSMCIADVLRVLLDNNLKP